MIKKIEKKEDWEMFLQKCEDKTFLHSWNWGEFQKKMGAKIWRLGVYDNNELLAVCFVVKIKAKRGTYLLVEHGPITKPKAKSQKLKLLKELLDYLRKIGIEEKAGFIRICPIWERNEENISIFRNLGFRQAPMHEHPEVSWVLPLNKTEDELLIDMRKTTRYLIRQALKNPDIEIKKSRNIEDVEIFYRLYQETVKREHFSPFSLNYLRNEFLAFSDDNQVNIFLGKYKNEVVSGAVIIFSQDSAFYHQGASLRKYAKIPVSYLLQWEAIKEAKDRGLKYYSFWGIADIDQNSKFKIFTRSSFAKQNLWRARNSKFRGHPWKGLTLFKKGFGGRKEEYVKTQDFVISKKYYLNFIIERLRKIKRGF